MKKMCKFVADCVAKRRSRGPSQYKDLFYYLAHEDEPDYKLDLALLQEDAKVTIVAGSDTTSTTLANLFFYLMTNQEVFSSLRAELDQAFPPGEGDPFDFSQLAELPYLNAVMSVLSHHISVMSEGLSILSNDYL